MKQYILALLLIGAQAHKLVHRNTYGVGDGETLYNEERDSNAGYSNQFIADKYPKHDHKDVSDFVAEHVDPSSGRFLTLHEAELNYQKKLDAEL